MLSTQEKTAQGEAYPNVRDVVQRRDELMARTVDRGILLQNSVSTMCGLEYLYSEGVSHVVAQRVLLEPLKRRVHIL